MNREELTEFSQILTRITVETALNAELDEHLGYDKHQKLSSGNSRNGYAGKTLLTEDGPIDIAIPRDRNGSFEPQLVKKHQRRFTAMDDKVLSSVCQGHDHP